MTKAELRTLFLEKRRSLSVDDIAKLSGLIENRFFESLDLAHVRDLHCFITIEKFNEIDTSLIYRHVWTDLSLIRTSVPRMDHRTGELESIAFDAETELAANNWGIPEPVGKATVAPTEIDLVLVPLLCFDERGYRVGYGKGLYDQFLKDCGPDCLKVGLSLFHPVDRIDDIHEGDVRLDMCITPDSEYRFE